jgi:hypothetical protein
MRLSLAGHKRPLKVAFLADIRLARQSCARSRAVLTPRGMNFNQDASAPLSVSFQNFARNDTGDQAFIDPTHTAGFNRPTNVRFGPDGCAHVVDFGAVRDPGGGPAAIRVL